MAARQLDACLSGTARLLSVTAMLCHAWSTGMQHGDRRWNYPTPSSSNGGATGLADSSHRTVTVKLVQDHAVLAGPLDRR